jgi:hypothetical protein
MFFKKTPKHDGLIGFYGLSEWWHTSFTDEEKETILEKYSRYNSQHQLLTGFVDERAQTAVAFLAYLAQWFTTVDPVISAKMMEKAEGLLESALPTEMKFSILASCIEIYYKTKDSQNFITRFDRAGKSLMEILPDYEPFHLESGMRFKIDSYCLILLVAVYKKAGRYPEAAYIATQAKSKNWPGDWDHQLSIIKKKQQLFGTGQKIIHARPK